jgi:hypothetical protein
MRKVHLLILGMLLPAIGLAQSKFDGTWTPNYPERPKDRKPESALLANGQYECPSCAPPYKIKADGQDQAIAGNPYYDKLKITITDDHSIIKTAKKNGKVTMEARVVVAADDSGKTEVQTLYDMAARPIELTSKYRRTSAAAPGSHRVSGGWQLIEYGVSNHAEDTTFKVSDGGLSMSDNMGRSFSAKFDGTAAPYKGSDEFDGVSLKLIDDKTIEESDLHNGKVVKISRWTLAPDGRTIHARFDDTHGHIQEQDGHKLK